MTAANPYLRGLYSGSLAEAIHRAPLNGVSGSGLLNGFDPKQAEAAEAHADQMRRAKLPDLFEHFEIDPAASDSWERLAISLATAHVPGFQVAPSFDPGTLMNPHLWNPYLGPQGASWAALSGLHPAKRKRGRPKKVPQLIAGSGGLLGWLIDKPKRGRPSVASEDKSQAVEWFDVLKARQGPGTTDEKAADVWLTQQRPELNTYHRGRVAKNVVRKVRRWRNELKRFGNSEENPT